MNERDRSQLDEILRRVNGVSKIQRSLNSEILGSWFSMLICFDIGEIANAFSLHTSTDGYMPSPADIRDIITEGYGWPIPGQAWEMCPKTESCGSWVCDEIMLARDSCRGEIERGHFGAKNDFEKVYAKLVKNAKYEGRTPHFFYSGPSDGNSQERTRIEQNATDVAYSRGLISLETKTSRMEMLCVGKSVDFDIVLIGGKKVNLVEQQNRIELSPEQEEKAKKAENYGLEGMRRLREQIIKNSKKITEDEKVAGNE